MASDLSAIETLLEGIYEELKAIHFELDSRNEASFAKELINAVEWVDSTITDLKKP